MNFLKAMTQKIEGVPPPPARPPAAASAPVPAVPTVELYKGPVGTTSKQQKETQFTHSKNVIIRKGIYKGKRANVVEKFNKKLEVAIKQREYVFAEKYGNQLPGTTITTPSGPITILEQVPQLYEIKLKDNQIVRFPQMLLRRVVSFFDNVSQMPKLGLLTGISEKDGVPVYTIIPYNLDYTAEMSLSDLLEQLSQLLRKNTPHDSLLQRKDQRKMSDVEMEDITTGLKKVGIESEDDELQILTTRMGDIKMASPVSEKIDIYNSITITPEQLIIPSQATEKERQLREKAQAFMQKTLNINTSGSTAQKMTTMDTLFIIQGQLVGMYGDFVRVIKEQYLIEYDKFILIEESQFNYFSTTLEVGTKGTIKSGPYKNQTATVSNIFPQTFSLALLLPGKKTETIIKTYRDFSDKSNVGSPITEDAIIFLDAKLKNGNYFQVERVSDGVIAGNEIKEGTFVPAQITRDDILSFGEGFSFGMGKEPVVQIQQEEREIVEPTVDEENMVTKEIDPLVADDEEVEDMDDFGYEPEEEKVSPDAVGETEERVDGFKDKERTQFALEELPKQQEGIRQKMEKYLKLFEINIRDVMKYVTEYQNAIAISRTIEKMKREIDAVKPGFWKVSDEKYVVACFVYYEILGLGMNYAMRNAPAQDPVSFFIDTMVSAGVFRKSDIQSSVFLTNGWTPSFVVDVELAQRLYNENRVVDLYRMMFLNAHKAIQSDLPALYKTDIERTIPRSEVEIVPLRRKKPAFVNTTVLISDILSGDIPETAKKIIWGTRFQPILEKYKELLRGSIKKARNDTTREIYTFLLENIDQAPFVLKKLQEKINKDRLKIDQRKATELRKMFNLILSEIRESVSKTESERANIREQRDEEYQRVIKYRGTIARAREEAKRLFGESDSESENEDDVKTDASSKRGRFQ